MRKQYIVRGIFCLLWLGVGCLPVRADGPRHYVFFGMERERIQEPAFWETKAFEGAQLKYTWRELEPEPNAYDFRAIRKDLAFLTSKGKRLFLQLQDVTFSPAYICVPPYLRSNPRFHGGADKQYTLQGTDETRAEEAGWVARRWDKAVQARFHKLLAALGREFDGKIEGINLPETSVDFGESGRLFPKGFTPSVYCEAILQNMAALKRAFPKSVTMQYANFMPGEWLPANDHRYLRRVYQRAQALKVGVGGPDLLPYRPGQRNHSYPLIRASQGRIPTGIAVQDGNYEAKNPQTGEPPTLAELLAFAHNNLKVDYLFWGAQEPFYSQKLLPFLRNNHANLFLFHSRTVWRVF